MQRKISSSSYKSYKLQKRSAEKRKKLRKISSISQTQNVISYQMPTHPMRERIYAASTTLEDTCKEEIKGAEGKNLTN